MAGSTRNAAGRYGRVLTLALAKKFRETLLSDLSHNIESAATTAGMNASTVRSALKRAMDDACSDSDDEAVCGVLLAAKIEHLRQLRKSGFDAAKRDNRAGTSHTQWRLENEDPLNYGRKRDIAIELTGKDGGPVRTSTTLTADAARTIRDQILYGDEAPVPAEGDEP